MEKVKSSSFGTVIPQSRLGPFNPKAWGPPSESGLERVRSDYESRPHAAEGIGPPEAVW